MGLSKDICAKIFNAHRQIEIAYDLLKKVTKDIEDLRSKKCDLDPKDNFVYKGLELSIRDSDLGGAYNVLRVAPEIAIEVINAHITNMEAEIAKLNEMAKEELYG